MIKFNDIRFLTVIFVGVIALNFTYNIVPWKVFFLLGGATGAVALFAKYDLNEKFGSRKTRELEVEPVDAPKKINQKVNNAEGYKKIDLEKTGEASRNLHTDTQSVRVDGEDKNLMFGIVGWAENPYKNNQILAYIFDLHEGRIRKYSSQRYTGQSRLQPFEGKHSWLQAEGISDKTIKDSDSTGPSVVVENKGYKNNSNGD